MVFFYTTVWENSINHRKYLYFPIASLESARIARLYEPEGGFFLRKRAHPLEKGVYRRRTAVGNCLLSIVADGNLESFSIGCAFQEDRLSDDL